MYESVVRLHATERNPRLLKALHLLHDNLRDVIMRVRSNHSPRDTEQSDQQAIGLVCYSDQP